MLEIVRYNQDEYDFPCLLVLGCFDGLHIGHAELLNKAKLQAKINGLDLGVMIFSDGKSGKQVFTFEERLKFLESFNVKFVLKIDFTEEFKATEALDFLKIVEDKLNVKAYMSGKDFRFGADAKGKASTLKKYAEDDDNGVWYMPVKDVTDDDGLKIGTSHIKELIAAGDIKNANRLLGRNFSVSGTVIRGANRGHGLLGFPTMNIEYPENKVELKHGVYTVQCEVDGTVYGGIANYGARPTFNEENALLEVHLAGFNGDLYGKTVTVEFTDFIRDIEKFDTAEELKARLERDLARLGGEKLPEAEEQPAAFKEEKEEEKPVEAVEISEPENQPSEEIGAGICADESQIEPENIPLETVTEEVQEATEAEPEVEETAVTEVLDAQPAEDEAPGRETDNNETDGDKID